MRTVAEFHADARFDGMTTLLGDGVLGVLAGFGRRDAGLGSRHALAAERVDRSDRA